MIQIYYQNVRGLRTKTSDFFSRVACDNYDIVVITETWCDGSVFDSELFDDRYVVYRRDGESSNIHGKSDGGGVAVAVSKCYISSRLRELESNCEDIWLRIKSFNERGQQMHFYLCSVYLRSPLRQDVLEDFLVNSNRVLEQNKIENVIFVGDFM